MQEYWIIYNGKAGRATEFAEVLRTFGSESTRRIEMTRDLDLAATLQAAWQHGVRTVIAAGGDGTVNAIVNALMHLPSEQRPCLAVLPMGTANDFAGMLALPDTPPEFFELLETSQCIPIDVVRIRADGLEYYYANVAAGGNSVRVSEEMTDELKEQWGAFCYLRGSLQVLGDLQTYRVTVDLGGERLEDIGSWAVIVANGRTNAGRILVAPEASPIDGLLDVILIRDGTVADIVELASSALLGSYLECEQVIYRQVPYLKLHSEPGMRFTLDGEIVDEEPVEFEVMPRAISMVVGSQFLIEHGVLQASGDRSRPSSS